MPTKLWISCTDHYDQMFKLTVVMYRYCIVLRYNMYVIFKILAIFRLITLISISYLRNHIDRIYTYLAIELTLKPYETLKF